MRTLILFLLGFLSVMNSSGCYSQVTENNNREFKSETKFVYGYLNNVTVLDLGITFGKVIDPDDTTYYVKFQLYAPNSELRQDIQINRTSSITFLFKSGKRVDLELTDVISYTENEKQTDNPYSSVKSTYSTVFILNVTKEQLFKIGSEPFYQLILPYSNRSSEIENQAIFEWPSLFTRRTFTRKCVRYILDI